MAEYNRPCRELVDSQANGHLESNTSLHELRYLSQ
jgi:hypothetical protein